MLICDASITEQVELETSPVGVAIQDTQENSISDQANEKTERAEVSAGAVPSAAEVPRCDFQDEVEVNLTDRELLGHS